MKLSKEKILERAGGINGLVNLLISSLEKTVENDGDILERGQTEELFVGYWANNIRDLIHENVSKDLRVDAPYNKHGSDPKHFELDLAIHIRDTDEYNIFAMEVETNNYPKMDDIDKLKLLTNPSGDYKYTLGLYIALGVKEKASIILNELWFVNGQERTKEVGRPITDFYTKSTKID